MKYLVIKRHCGWGVRLLCLAESIEYCKRTDRMLVIDWWQDKAYSNYFQDGVNKNTFDLYFELDDFDHLSSLPLVHGNTYVPKYWNKNNVYDFVDHVSIEEYKHDDYWVPLYSDELIEYNEDVILSISSDKHVDYDELENYEMIRDFSIKLKRNVVDIADEFCEKNDIENLIGIHGRYSPLFDTLEGNKLKFPAKGIIKVRKNVKDKKVFLATDSQKIKNMISEVAEVVDYKKHTELGDIKEWDDMVWLNSIPYVDHERKGLEALVDCLILSRCKEFISLNKFSHFSKMTKIFRMKGL